MSFIGDSRCGEIFQRWPLLVTTVTVLRLYFPLALPARNGHRKPEVSAFCKLPMANYKRVGGIK